MYQRKALVSNLSLLDEVKIEKGAIILKNTIENNKRHVLILNKVTDKEEFSLRALPDFLERVYPGSREKGLLPSVEEIERVYLDNNKFLCDSMRELQAWFKKSSLIKRPAETSQAVVEYARGKPRGLFQGITIENESPCFTASLTGLKLNGGCSERRRQIDGPKCIEPPDRLPSIRIRSSGVNNAKIPFLLIVHAFVDYLWYYAMMIVMFLGWYLSGKPDWTRLLVTDSDSCLHRRSVCIGRIFIVCGVLIGVSPLLERAIINIYYKDQLVEDLAEFNVKVSSLTNFLYKDGWSASSSAEVGAVQDAEALRVEDWQETHLKDQEDLKQKVVAVMSREKENDSSSAYGKYLFEETIDFVTEYFMDYLLAFIALELGWRVFLQQIPAWEEENRKAPKEHGQKSDKKKYKRRDSDSGGSEAEDESSGES